jgi:hypothetical protein
MLVFMTVSDRIEQQGFAYDTQFPPDVAEGLPLTAICKRRQRAPFKRALRSCARMASVVSRKQR